MFFFRLIISGFLFFILVFILFNLLIEFKVMLFVFRKVMRIVFNNFMEFKESELLKDLIDIKRFEEMIKIEVLILDDIIFGKVLFDFGLRGI